jgi:hypothetical protein
MAFALCTTWLLTNVAQVETMLKTQDKPEDGQDEDDMTPDQMPASLSSGDYLPETYKSMEDSAYTTLPPPRAALGQQTWNDPTTWDLIGLGTEEPMPSLDAQNEL